MDNSTLNVEDNSTPIHRVKSREEVLKKHARGRTRNAKSESDAKYDPYCVCNIYKSGALSIQCDKCYDHWHLDCVSLKGLTKPMIDAIELWHCPNCFVSPYVKGNHDSLTGFLDGIETIKKCNGDLEESKKSLELFNAHMRHFLLDQEHSTVSFKSLCTDVVLLKKQIGEVHGVTCLPDEVLVNSYRGVEVQVGELTKEIAKLKTSTVTQSSAVSDNIKDRLTSLEVLCSKISTDIDELEIPTNASDIKRVLEEFQNSPVTPVTAGDGLTSNPPPLHTPSRKPTNIAIPKKVKPFDRMLEQFLTEEHCESILDKYSSQKAAFAKVGGSRKTIYYGEYDYKYTGGRHKAAPIPKDLKEIIESIGQKIPTATINSCLVTLYEDGADFCPPHCDDESWINPESSIYTISLGAERVMKFTPVHGSDNPSVDHVETKLPSGSLLSFTRQSQAYWKHAVPADPSIKTSRMSLTLRHVAPHYQNSTILIGDSNTKYLKFGDGDEKNHTFGKWVPGQRLKASRVEHIPSPVDLAPYRNIVIHTGVNNLHADSFGPPPHILITRLEQKCAAIHAVYPTTKIVLCPLLPTKNRVLNLKVNTMNGLIHSLSLKHPNLCLINPANYCDASGKLKPELGRYCQSEGKPLETDELHLGRQGIRMLAKSIKDFILPPKSVRKEFNGEFLAAAKRGVTSSQANTSATAYNNG
jgi:alkylated DNA repair dioxygenase AlkB